MTMEDAMRCKRVKAASQAERKAHLMIGELKAFIHWVALEKSLNLSRLPFSHFKTKVNNSYNNSN